MTKRLPLILAAIVACMAIGAVSASAKDTVGSTIKVKYKGAKPGDPYGTSAFTGKVGPRECAADRKIKIKGVKGKDTTDDSGKFSLTLSGPADPGRYKVTAASIKNDDGDTCKKVSATVTISKTG
jgi:hypothetical protein